MNREEQIAYAAKDYCKRNRPSLDSKVLPYIEFGFNQGAIWADKHQRWISVNEKLPAEVFGASGLAERRIDELLEDM